MNFIKYKKERTEVPLRERLKALKEVRGGTSISKIAERLNVHHTTVRWWIKNEDKLADWCGEYDNVRRTRKRMSINDENSQVNKAMWEWFKEKRADGHTVTGPMIQAQALEFNAQFGANKNFKASKGWLRSWKDRYNIRAFFMNGWKQLNAAVQPVNNYTDEYVNYMATDNVPEEEFKFVNTSQCNEDNAENSEQYEENEEKMELASTSRCQETLRQNNQANSSQHTEKYEQFNHFLSVIKNDEHQEAKDARLCLKYLLNYCERNSCNKSIEALSLVKAVIENDCKIME